MREMREMMTNNSQLKKSIVSSQLPKGWKVKKLGEVCEVIVGQSPESRYYNINSEGLPFYQGEKEFIYKYIGEPTKWTTKITKIAQKDDILMSVRAPVGPVNFATEKICIGRGLAAIRCKNSVDKDFIFNFLKNYEEEIIGNAGAVFNSINKKQIENIEVPIPPLSEQKRIVSLLDRAFEAIDQAKAHAEINLKNAKELFDSYLNRIFEEGGGDWVEKKLKEISKINYGYTEKASLEKIGPKFLRITDIQNNNVDWDSVPYCHCSEKDLSKYKLEFGDIVFARTGATTGKSFLIKEVPNAVFASYLIRLKIKEKDKFEPNFVSYFFQTKMYWDIISSGISGSAQGGFNATKLGELIFNFPKLLEDQKRIVQELDALQTETKKLEAIYQKKIVDLEELKKSVLQKAFRGEL